MSEEAQCPPSKRQKLDESAENNTEIDFSEDLVAKGNDEEFQVAEDKFDNFVRPEDLEKLREFKVLDEVKSNDEDSDDDDSESSDGKSEGVPEDEIEKMLEEDLPEGFKGVPKPKEKPYITRQKSVLEEKGVNHFEVLPLDWMMVRHYSGMPVYMHRGTRVCTLSKPYSLGKGNTRRHDIPISSIPCYAYRRALEEEEKQKEIDERIKEQIESGAWAKQINMTTDQSKQDKSQINNVDQLANNSNQVNDNRDDVSKETVPKCQKDVSAETKEIANEINEITNDIEMKNVKMVCPFRNKDTDVTENGVGIDNENTNVSNENSGNVENDEKNNANDEPKQEEIPLNRQPVVLPGGIVMPPPRVETVNTSWKTQQLTPEKVNEYCKRLFKFKTVNIMHFKRWADRRKYAKARKTLQYPTLPDGTKLITIPAQPSTGPDNGGKAHKRDWVMNMNGRSYLSVFHEYVRRALQKQPVYEFKQLENASSPYQATVYIGGMQYGSGRGSSKRQAKSAAARASIHILIPEMRTELDTPQCEPDFTFFDYVGIEDPRITEFCAATCEPSPHAILRTCLLRNFGAGDRHIHTEMKKLEYQKMELTMKVGKHTATVVCKNKKTAKQRASQAILQFP